jgi:hypothetical protein
LLEDIMSDEIQEKTTANVKSNEELSTEELGNVNGGSGTEKGTVEPVVSGTIVGPRDPAQGLPTGKRM